MNLSFSSKITFSHAFIITYLLSAPLFAADNPRAVPGPWISTAFPLNPVSLSALNAQMRQAMQPKPRLPLAAEDDIIVREAATAGIEPGRAPNYLRALATQPQIAKPFAQLLKTAIFSGSLSPETKLAMGVRVAQLHRSTYVGAHTQRWLLGCPNGARWISSLKTGKTDALSAPDHLALRYAERLTQNIHGVDEAEFERLRAHFNDSQIVELTLTTCFWNYFTRLSSGWNLPVEAWALPQNKSTFSPPASQYEAPFARVSLISNAEIESFALGTQSLNAARQPSPPLSLPLAQGDAPSPSATAPIVQNSSRRDAPVTNSLRAMMHVPQFGAAWFEYWRAVRERAAGETSIGREILLQVSFAVSMANGCRYCTLHQVQGLRRLGVDPSKLVAMKKDDANLTPRERVAVVFARKMTRDPAAVTDSDFALLQREFGNSGATEVLLQTSAFNFMNRFTDGLNLPSEDEAIKIYSEVYNIK